MSNVRFQVSVAVGERVAFEEILQLMFPQYQAITVDQDFSADSRSGSWVFLVNLAHNEASHLPAAVKIAAVSLIEKEWQAYNKYIRGLWPGAAEIKHEPTIAGDGALGGLSYELVGEGIFPVQSLRQYCLEASVDDIQFVFRERLAPRLSHVLNFRKSRLHVPLHGSYDPILPVNLLVTPTQSPPNIEPIQLNSDTLPPPLLEPGGYVKLSDFVVNKVDLKRRTVTLNVPRPDDDLPTESYLVRLKYNPDMPIPAYTVGQPLPMPITGQISKTRNSQWQEFLRPLISDQQVSLKSETVHLPNGTKLPNPLTRLSNILDRLRNVKVNHIHGDLNLENILVDPQTRDVRLIDFAEARRDHVLHDFLRLETEVITKLVPKAFIDACLPVETIHPFYDHLHYASFHRPIHSGMNAPHSALKKAFAILQLIRETARDYGLFDPNAPEEYYHCLIIYLMGALKFANLDRKFTDPKPWPKQVAFWGAATLLHILESGDRTSSGRPMSEQFIPTESDEPSQNSIIHIAGNVEGHINLGGHSIQLGEIRQSQVNIGAVHSQSHSTKTTQTIITGADLVELQRLFFNLKGQAELQAPKKIRHITLRKLTALEVAITAEEPDLNTMTEVGDWFSEQSPGLVELFDNAMRHPIITKFAEAAGEATLTEFQKRFG